MTPIERLLIDLESDALSLDAEVVDPSDASLQDARARAAELLARHGFDASARELPTGATDLPPARNRSRIRPDLPSRPRHRSPRAFQLAALAASLLVIVGVWGLFGTTSPDPISVADEGSTAAAGEEPTPQPDAAKPERWKRYPKQGPTIASGTYRQLLPNGQGERYLRLKEYNRGQLLLHLSSKSQASFGADRVWIDITWSINNETDGLTLRLGDVAPSSAENRLAELGLQSVMEFSIAEARLEGLELLSKDRGTTSRWVRTKWADVVPPSQQSFESEQRRIVGTPGSE